MTKRFFFIYLLPILLAGCAEFYGNQPPAPVYGSRPTGNNQEEDAYPAAPQHKPRRNKHESTGTVMTEPLKEPGVAPESIEFKSEPLSTETEPDGQVEGQLPLTQSLEQAPSSQEPSQESLALTPFEPMEISAALSPAVDALVVAANQNSSSGNLEVASATIERAIRIEPRNANLYYKLALVRLKQSKPRLAEDLAKKSAFLAVNDSALKKHSWLLIAHARELQNNFKGAKEARAKANRL